MLHRRKSETLSGELTKSDMFGVKSIKLKVKPGFLIHLRLPNIDYEHIPEKYGIIRWQRTFSYMRIAYTQLGISYYSIRIYTLCITNISIF